MAVLESVPETDFAKVQVAGESVLTSWGRVAEVVGRVPDQEAAELGSWPPAWASHGEAQTWIDWIGCRCVR